MITWLFKAQQHPPNVPFQVEVPLGLLSATASLLKHLKHSSFFKSGYRKGLLAANKEAHKHAQFIFDLLDSEGCIVEDPKWKGKAREVDFEMLD